MNNLQHIVKDNTRFAMHMAVELCEQGDFDNVTEAFKWLMQERDTTHGTLTAEQVKRIHDVIEKHWHDLPADYDMPEATALPEYSYNWQAIADELNATLGGGECKLLVDGDLLHCSNCGGAAEKQSWAYWNYCPNCGKAVKR